MTRLALNANAGIIDELNGNVTINTGTDTTIGAEFGFTTDGQFTINGTPFTGGGEAPTLPPGPSRVSLDTTSGAINILTGVEADGSVFSLTPDGKIKVNGTDYVGAAPAAAADPAWSNANLLNGWKNATSLNSYPMEPAKYRRNGNKIEFSGMIDGTTATQPAGQTNLVFRLPNNLAPLVQYQKALQVSVNGNVSGQLKVLSDGNTIGVYYVAGVANAGGTATLSLCNVAFYLDKASV